MNIFWIKKKYHTKRFCPLIFDTCYFNYRWCVYKNFWLQCVTHRKCAPTAALLLHTAPNFMPWTRSFRFESELEVYLKTKNQKSTSSEIITKFKSKIRVIYKGALSDLLSKSVRRTLTTVLVTDFHIVLFSIPF